MKQQQLFEESIQLESLPENWERPYQRMIAFLARCLPGAVALLLLLIVYEGATGRLSTAVGKAWIRQLGRTPSTVGGQGNIGLQSILAMVKERFSQGNVRFLFVGDSVFAPNLGGGSVNEHALGNIVSSHLKDSLNIAQEGGEWGMNALLIRKLALDPSIREKKPVLVFPVNFKFFALSNGFAPAYPTEMGLCADPAILADGETDPDIQAVCESISRDWPKALAYLSRHLPFVYRGIQGQLDFMMTFVQRSPLYQFNVRGWGKYPYRTLLPGIVDAKMLAEAYAKQAPAPWFVSYQGGAARGMNQYVSNIYDGYSNPSHPKHAWIRELAKAAATWPGPVLALWVNPSPNAMAALVPEVQGRVAKIEARMREAFSNTGKPDLHFISSTEMLSAPDTYLDSDHLSPQGHRVLAEFLARKFGGMAQ